MNINQVRYFVLVHDCRSFSAAAKQRGISVQAVSKAVGELEREVGCDLLARSSRGVIATPAGKAFYQRARLAVTAFDNLENFSPEEAVAGKNGPIKIALCSPEFDNADVLLKSFVGFLRKSTGFNIELSLANVAHAQDLLESGAYNALVTIGGYSHEGTECHSLGTLPTGIRVVRTHPLASRDVVTLEDLRNYPAGKSQIIDDFNTSIFQMYEQAGILGPYEEVGLLAENSTEFMVDHQGYFFSAIFPRMSSATSQLALIPIEPEQALRVPICVVTLTGHMLPEIEAVRALMLQGAGFGK